MMNTHLATLIQNGQGTIVDVRSFGEFMGGHPVGALNIPLHEIPSRVEEIKALKSPLILCCASGNRSGEAQRYLSAQGIECYNGGSWLDVNYWQTQTQA
jgi:rhodanese-related sulfurtransferase